MASLIHCFDPGIIVLGGAVIQHNQWLVEIILEKTKEKVFPNLINKVKIVVSEFGNDAGLIGAGYMTLKNN
jgi:glucokinase